MRILITGADGQLGRDLHDCLEGRVPRGGRRCALLGPEGARPGVEHEVLGTDIGNMPVDDRDAVLTTFADFRPELVLHGGALTAVDRCETEADLAFAVNAVGTRHVAEAAALVGAHVVYVSTDYVFDGTSDRPYREWDAPCPKSVYGASKLAGEQECRPGSTIVRTSWVCGAHGANMVVTALRLASESDGELRFIDDQHGSPTFTADLAPGDRDPRPRPPARALPHHQQRRHHVVGPRAGRPGRGRCRSRAGAPDHDCGAGPTPARTAPGQLGPRQHGPAPEWVPALPDWQDGLTRLVAALRAQHTGGMNDRTGRQMVAVIGAGYVGLPTAATLAHFGHHVVLAERDTIRLSALRSGRMPIVEAGLDELVAGGVAAGNLSFTESSVEAVKGASFVFLCVPTPQSADGSADLSYVEAAAREIASSLEPGAIVVNKSTVPVGSANMVDQVIGRPDIGVVSNPEFLREGTAVPDSLNPDRIVVGADDARGGRQCGGTVLLDPGSLDRDRRHDVGDDQVRVERISRHQA